MKLLSELGSTGIPKISDIYAKAVSSIEEPKPTENYLSEINKLDWFEAKQGRPRRPLWRRCKRTLTRRNRAGQYFTPRVLIDDDRSYFPETRWKCFDPACGTFGFMDFRLSARYWRCGSLPLSDQEMAAFQDSSMALNWYTMHTVSALMNAYLHNEPAHISGGPPGPSKKGWKVLMWSLTNPPFRNPKKAESGTSRDDSSFSNQQTAELAGNPPQFKSGRKCTLCRCPAR